MKNKNENANIEIDSIELSSEQELILRNIMNEFSNSELLSKISYYAPDVECFLKKVVCLASETKEKNDIIWMMPALLEKIDNLRLKFVTILSLKIMEFVHAPDRIRIEA